MQLLECALDIAIIIAVIGIILNLLRRCLDVERRDDNQVGHRFMGQKSKLG